MSVLITGKTIVTVHDPRSTHVEVPLDGTIDWGTLGSHLNVKCARHARKMLDVVIGFEEGSLQDKDILVSWHTGPYSLDPTKNARRVKVFLK